MLPATQACTPDAFSGVFPVSKLDICQPKPCHLGQSKAGLQQQFNDRGVSRNMLDCSAKPFILRHSEVSTFGPIERRMALCAVLRSNLIERVPTLAGDARALKDPRFSAFHRRALIRMRILPLAW
jgi:hypothetical protein